MSRYIDLEELERRIREHIKAETLEEKALIEWRKDECIRQAYCMPTADVAPKSEGEWVIKDLDNPLYESKKAPHCSNCGYMSFIKYDYCPNCGAKMKGGAE